MAHGFRLIERRLGALADWILSLTCAAPTVKKGHIMPPASPEKYIGVSGRFVDRLAPDHCSWSIPLAVTTAFETKSRPLAESNLFFPSEEFWLNNKVVDRGQSRFPSGKTGKAGFCLGLGEGRLGKGKP
jgi:hypothetical protein